MKNVRWIKSTRSGTGGNCVETRAVLGAQLVRDSKLGDTSPILSAGRIDWRASVAS